MNYKNGDFTRINVSSDMSEDDILTSISQILGGFEQVKDFLNNLETTLNNSIASVDVFSDTTISGYVTTVGTYTTSLQASYATIISFESTVSSFLQTYKDTEVSLQKQIELLKQDREILVKSLGISELGAEIGYERTIIGTDDQISSLDLQLQIAKNTYDNAIKTRSVNLRNLQNAINEAQIAYNQAKNEYDKLTITSPIDGTIGSVMLDVGQEVTVGTKAFEILNTGTPEITIALSLQEQSLVMSGNEVYVRVGTKKYTGTIVSVSSIADANLQYETTIIMKESFATLGDIVDIMIPVGSDEVLVPINIVDVNGAE
ncbi:MAG: HlyD family efflux transporter periplasmic adaptor subunit [Candidatus Peribacteria bacterium]|nr:MAG: HlyD family efflux transporter periplasmic adaptor subunit [Candidatus Peribacteria bacterium]